MKKLVFVLTLLLILVACKSQGRAFELPQEQVAKSEVTSPPPVVDARDLPKQTPPGQFGEEQQKYSHFGRAIETSDGSSR
jgi:hypothetical protein